MLKIQPLQTLTLLMKLFGAANPAAYQKRIKEDQPLFNHQIV